MHLAANDYIPNNVRGRWNIFYFRIFLLLLHEFYMGHELKTIACVLEGIQKGLIWSRSNSEAIGTMYEPRTTYETILVQNEQRNGMLRK